MSSEARQAICAPVPAALPSLIYRPSSYVQPLDLGDLFPKSQPLEIELGSGDGSFLIRYAQLHPDHNFLGVERLLGRLRKVDRKVLRAGLTNVRLIRLEASYVISYLMPKESAVALHVYFPDPWPKRRHWKHRLINQEFIRLAWQVLSPGGVIYLRTDNADYFAQMTRVFEVDGAFKPDVASASLGSVMTDFEVDFRARGVPIFSAAYQRPSNIDNRPFALS